MADDDPAQAQLKADASHLLETVAQLPPTLSRLLAFSKSLPSDEDFHFYSNFPAFRDPILGLQSRVEALLSQISSLSVIPRAPSWPSDAGESLEWLVGVQDEILERVDSAFDLFKKERATQGFDDDGFIFQKVRKKRRREGRDIIREMQPPKDAKGNLGVNVNDGKKMERCPIPFHVWSIPRPQDKFDVPVDNSNTPFKHPKQLRRLSVEEASASRIPSEPAHVAAAIESNDSAHPLEEELRSMDFADPRMLGTIDPKKPKALSETPFTFVDTPAALKDLAVKLLLEQEIAVDLEHHQFRTFQGFTCLMQISTQSEDFIIDTLELRSLIGPLLLGVFANPTIQKVMHGADWDILWLQRDFGIYVCNLFDTGQASRVLGMKSYSLLHLLEHFCGVVSDKRYQMADWRLRPLPTEMLRYAREDTHYLLYVGDLMKQMLVSAQYGLEDQDSLLEVYKRSRDICLKLYEKEITTDTSFLQVYGLREKQFQGEQLAVLDALYSWRDQVARTEDESTGYVLPNHLLLKLAEEMPDNVKKLRSMLSGRHPLITHNIATIVAIICKSRLNGSMYTNQVNELKVEAEKTKYVHDVPFALDHKASDASIGERTNGGVHINPLSRKVERASTGDNMFNVDWISTDPRSADTIPTVATKESQDECLQQTVLDIAANESDFGESIKADTRTTTSCVVVKRSSTSTLLGNKKEKDTLTNRLQNTSTQNQVSLGVDEPREIKRDAEIVLSQGAVSVNDSMLTEKVMAEKSVYKCTSTVMRVGKNPLGGMASMFGRASYMQQKVKGNTIIIEDHEQTEARLKAEKIRASLALPFHSFDGVDQSHQAVTVHQEECRKLEAVNKHEEEHGTHARSQEVIADEYMSLHSKDTEGVQPEEVILFKADLSGKDEGNESRKDANLLGLVQEGIGTSACGTRYRQWWPDVACSLQQLSSDFVVEERSEIGEVQCGASELPQSISEKYWKSHLRREGRGTRAVVSSSTMNSVSAELSGYCTLGTSNAHALKHDVTEKKHPTFGAGEDLNSEERSVDLKPFDYEAARKTMGCFGGFTDAREGPALWKSKRSKQIQSGSGETSFDPLRKMKEFKPEGINPGKRRQVFPQTGNRTGVFK